MELLYKDLHFMDGFELQIKCEEILFLIKIFENYLRLLILINFVNCKFYKNYIGGLALTFAHH